ncbi:MAG TPA: sugar ABC transporter permease [Spirochaetales bacterium]|nr:sugar ABC transporter permease [Spirochaetales bacterium]HOV38278.1 sugar ABC transporter permease [Spirochaetales bacterium]
MQRINRTPSSVIAVFLLPSLIGFIMFILIPIVMAVGISFTNFSGGPRFRFMGFQNYLQAFRSADFQHNFWITLVFTFWTVLFQIVLGLGFALILNERLWARNLFRGILFLPNVLSSIAVGLAFMLIFDPQRGPLNQLLRSWGMDPPLWLGSEKTSLLTIILVTVWQSFGYYMVLFLGGLQTINRSLYEAASMDGAHAIRKFLSVTLPGLSPIMFYSITIAIIRAFQVFDQIFIMTGGQLGGGPAGSTSVLVFDIYRNGFAFFRFGYASAESVILLCVVFIVTFIQYRGQNRWVTYDVV